MSIKINGLKKWFGEPPTHVLKGIDLKIDDGEFVSIVGRSGSGKSTLLYIMSTLDDPSSGSVFYDDLEVSKMNEDAIHDLRNKELGFVFQFHYLLPELTVLENVLMPARKRHLHFEKEEYARHLLDQVGLLDKADSRATTISGGEQQRVAIARALVMKPKYLFADEPTGNLDSVNGDNIMELFKKINAEMGSTVIYVTHDLDYANMAKRKIELVDGVVSENVSR